MKRCLLGSILIIVMLTSFAYCDINMYWVCHDPNGYWTVPGNWYNSPGDPNFEYPGGLATSGGSGYDYGAYARVQQGSSLITDGYVPVGRILRLYLGGLQGAKVTIDTSSVIDIYKFYAGYGAGTESTLNIQNGTVTVTGSGSTGPYFIFANGGTSTLNMSGGTLNINDTTGGTYFCYETSSRATLNVTGGMIDCKGKVYFGYTADNTVICNIFGGTFKCTNNSYAPSSGSTAANNFTMNVVGGTWNPAGRVYLGNSSGSVSNVSLSSGTIQAGGKQFILGTASGGIAYYNQAGGTYKGYAHTDPISGFKVGYNGYGEATISGGTFDCNLPVQVYNGIFKVSGSNASAISVKSINSTSGDGFAFNFMNAGQTLAIELDAGGVTYIRAFNGGTNDPNGGEIKLNNGILTVDTLAGFSGTPGTEYPIMYSPKSISATGLKFIVLSPIYDFEYFIEDDTENGGQWLKLRQRTVSIWNGGIGLWDVAGNWTGGLPSLTQTAIITSGTVNLPASGICEAEKLNIGGSTPVLNIYNGSVLNTSSELFVSNADSSSAQINISGGKFNVNGNAIVAAFPASQATFTQTAGDVNILGELNMGYNTNTSSESAEVHYNISGGNFYQKGYVFRLGYVNSKGYFNQTGGNVIFDVNVNSSCRLGYSNGLAEYDISEGSLTAPTNFVIGSGHLAVLGSSVDSITFDRFRVGANTGILIVGLDGTGCTPIVTTSHSVFESGSNLVIRLLPGFSGTYNQFYDIVQAATTIDDEGLNISCEDANYTFEYRISNMGSGGQALSVGVGFRNQKAYNPSPSDNSIRCYQDVQTLSWTNPLPSQIGGHVLCDVWFSDASVDPNFTNPMQLVNKQDVDSVTVTLDPEKEYLWRVDIYDQSYGTERKVTGTRWNFETNPVAVKTFEWNFENAAMAPASYEDAINGNNIIAIAHDSYSVNVAQNVVNGWGLEGMKHCTATKGMWRAVPNWDTGVTCQGCSTLGAGWIKFDFDKVYSLGKIWVWNHNYAGTDILALGWSIMDVTIEYSVDGINYNVLGDYTLNNATHAPGYEHNTEIDFGGINAKSVVLTVDFYNSNYGGDYIGLSEVRFGLHNTTATETNVPDVVGTCQGKSSGSVGVVHSSLYDSAKCIDINDGFDYLYSSSGTADVPTSPDAKWTINCFVYADRIPEDGVLLAGFGDVFDPNEGTKRFIDAKSGGYIGFWGGSDATTITGDTKFDIRKWQLITATCDGVRVRLYKNADWIGSVNMVGDFNVAEAKVLIVPRNGREVVTNFYGKIDDVAIYNSVLSVVEMQQLMERFPLMQDLNTDGAVDTKDLDTLADQWLTTAASWPGNTPGLSTWTESFEDGSGYQSRWTAYTGDWSGKSVVADPYAPHGSSALLLTLPSNHIERSIGTVSGVFETSWYFRAPDANGTGNAIVSVVDALGQSLVRVYHTPENGKIVISTGTGAKSYTYTPGNSYVKVTLRVDYSIGRCTLLINDNLFESGFVLHDPAAGPATGIRIRKYTNTQPNCYFDVVTVSQSALGVDYPLSDLDGNGFVNFKDFASFAEQWLSYFGE